MRYLAMSAFAFAWALYGQPWAKPVPFAASISGAAVSAELSGRVSFDGQAVEVAVENCSISRPEKFDSPVEIGPIRVSIDRVSGGQTYPVLPRRSDPSIKQDASHSLAPGQGTTIPPFTVRIPLGDVQLLKGDRLGFEIGVKYLSNGRAISGTVPVRSREPLPVSQTVVAYCADEVMILGGSLEGAWQVTELCQDSAGRRRTGIYIRRKNGPTNQPRSFEIADPVANLIYTVIPEKKQVLRKKGWTAAGVFGGVLGGIMGPIPGRSPAPQPKITTNFAGVKTIEGLDAYGTVATTVYPIGYQGATQEVTVISEKWYAPAINRIVLWTTKNSKTGETGQWLENVRLGEPDPSVFQIPAGYDIVDAR